MEPGQDIGYGQGEMNLKFRHKMFLGFLLNSFVIVICVLLFGRYYASRNFEEYIGKVERERLNQLADALSRKFQKTRTWEPILHDWDQWLELTAIGPEQPPRGAGRAQSHFPPPPPFLPSSSMDGQSEGGKPPLSGEPPPPPMLPPGPPPDHRAVGPRIALFDAEKSPLTVTDSSSLDGYRLRPIKVDDQVVGWLGIRKMEHPARPMDVEFIRHQSRIFYSIGAVALALALLVTFVLLRQLMAPVKKLAEGTRAMSCRRFETRIELPHQDELGQLAADFNAMAQALEKHEEMRRQWVADISHELRTPLAILRGEIEAMLDGIVQITRESLDSLHAEVMHLSRIVHDLHDLTLIESRTSEPEEGPQAPWEVLEETLRSFQGPFSEQGIAIEANGEGMNRVRIKADRGRLKQLFTNLLENTLRYAQSPGVLKISWQLAGNRLFLHFDDSGPGVPGDSLDRLFDRLYRVDGSRSRVLGGSGLGLAICRSIVERFGGRIEASHAPIGGLRITVMFPVLS